MTSSGPTALLSGVRKSVRSLRRARGFTSTAVITLALGIGLASATGVVARAIAFAGLPIPDAERVIVLWGEDRSGSFTHLPLAPLQLPPLADAMRDIATVTAGDYHGSYPWVFRAPDGSDTPLRLRGSLAGGNYFDVLGARPVLGRALRSEDDVIGAPRVMVLSHAAWRTHFGSDPEVIGRSLDAVQQGASYTIVGVMPPGLDVPRGVEFWTAFVSTAAVNGSLEGTWAAVDVIARLEPGATPEQARQVLASYYATLAAGGATHLDGARATVRTLPERITGDVRPAFTALAAAAVVVLLGTCANIVGLLLLRASRRRRELALRAALGAGRRRLLGDLLSEHAVLAIGGGVLGAGLAAVLVEVFAALAPAELPRVNELGIDWSLLVAVTLITSFVVIVVGLTPAVLASRVAPAAILGGAREGIGGRTGEVRLRRLLVAAQMALALVVLVAASLVGRSLAHLTELDLGLPAADQLAFVELVPPVRRETVAGTTGEGATALSRWRANLDAIMQRVEATPGVIAVAPVVHEPYAGSAGWDGMLSAEDAPPDDAAQRPYLNMELTNADYLDVTGVSLVAGRWFTEADRENTPRVIVLSEGAARLLFPGREAVGRRVRLWGEERATVIGLVADTRFREFLEPRASVYFPHRQFDAAPTFLAVRTLGDASRAASIVRSAVGEVDPAVLVHDHGTMHSRASAQVARPRIMAAVLGTYAIVIVVLAATGLYTVVAGGVAQRRREFGIRAALGATPRALMSLVLGEGMRMAALGGVVGLLVTLAGSRFVAALLHGVAPTDPATIAIAAATLFGIALAAVLVPARRAAGADPAVEMRAE